MSVLKRCFHASDNLFTTQLINQIGNFNAARIAGIVTKSTEAKSKQE